MSQEAPAPAAPKKSRKALVALVALVLLGGGGAGAFWMLRGPAVEAAPPPPPPGMVSFDPFVVNLADRGGGRYLRLTMSVVVASEEQALHFTEDAVLRTRVRSEILEMLAQETAERLTTPEGKAALKAAIVARAADGSEHLTITDVLFTEFIVQ